MTIFHRVLNFNYMPPSPLLPDIDYSRDTRYPLILFLHSTELFRTETKKIGKIVFHEKRMTTIFPKHISNLVDNKIIQNLLLSAYCSHFYQRFFFIINYVLFIFGGVELTRGNNCGCAMNKNDVKIEFGCIREII